LDDEREGRWDCKCTANATESSENEESDLLMSKSTDQMSNAEDECASNECGLGRIYIRNAAALYECQ
jgi:hypothetical protein